MTKLVIQQGWDTGSRLMPHSPLPSLVNRWLHAAFSIHSSSIRRSGLSKESPCFMLFPLLKETFDNSLYATPYAYWASASLSGRRMRNFTSDFPSLTWGSVWDQPSSTCHRELEPRMLNMSEAKTLSMTSHSHFYCTNVILVI